MHLSDSHELASRQGRHRLTFESEKDEECQFVLLLFGIVDLEKEAKVVVASMIPKQPVCKILLRMFGTLKKKYLIE